MAFSSSFARLASSPVSFRNPGAGGCATFADVVWAVVDEPGITIPNPISSPSRNETRRVLMMGLILHEQGEKGTSQETWDQGTQHGHGPVAGSTGNASRVTTSTPGRPRSQLASFAVGPPEPRALTPLPRVPAGSSARRG